MQPILVVGARRKYQYSESLSVPAGCATEVWQLHLLKCRSSQLDVPAPGSFQEPSSDKIENRNIERHSCQFAKTTGRSARPTFTQSINSAIVPPAPPISRLEQLDENAVPLPDRSLAAALPRGNEARYRIPPAA